MVTSAVMRATPNNGGRSHSVTNLRIRRVHERDVRSGSTVGHAFIPVVTMDWIDAALLPAHAGLA